MAQNWVRSGVVGIWDQRVTSGLYEIRSKFGSLEIQSMFKNGQKHGRTREFYTNGKVATDGHFKNGFAEGKFEEFDRLGKLREISWWRNGYEEGVRTTYGIRNTTRLYIKSDYGVAWSNEQIDVLDRMQRQFETKKDCFQLDDFIGIPALCSLVASYAY